MKAIQTAQALSAAVLVLLSAFILETVSAWTSALPAWRTRYRSIAETGPGTCR